MTEQIFKAKDRHGAELEFLIKEPTRTSESESDMNYRIAYGNALKFGLLTRDSIKQILKEHDIWRADDEKELNTILMELAKLELELKHHETAGDNEAATLVAGKLATNRARMWELTRIQHSPYTNSCEAYAELVRMESQMAASVMVKASGKRYWANYKEYVIERDNNEISEVPTKAMELTTAWLFEQQAKMLESPEQTWLKNIKAAALEDSDEKVAAELKRRAEESVANVEA